MSIQQVNLYLPELRPRKEVLSFVQCGWIVGALAGLLALLSVADSLRNAELAQQYADTKARIQMVEQEIVAVRQRMPASQAVQLQQSLDEASKTLADRQRLYELIQQQNLGNSDGFSETLLAMARQHQPDLSLQGFSLLAGGKQLHLVGETKTAAALPQYIQRLQTEPSLRDTRFGRLVVEREPSRRLAFHTGPELKEARR